MTKLAELKLERLKEETCGDCLNQECLSICDGCHNFGSFISVDGNMARGFIAERKIDRDRTDWNK